MLDRDSRKSEDSKVLHDESLLARSWGTEMRRTSTRGGCAEVSAAT